MVGKINHTLRVTANWGLAHGAEALLPPKNSMARKTL